MSASLTKSFPLEFVRPVWVSKILKCFGGIMLVVGTSIGGGMLALPVTCSHAGFVGSALSLFAFWVVMTMGALMILEVNLRFPKGSHFASMANGVLGRFAGILTSVIYLLLLYSILSAYLSGGMEVVQSLFSFHVSGVLSLLIFLLIFGSIVIAGVKCVDYINRVVMTGKIVTYVTIVVVTLPYIHSSNLFSTINMPHVSGLLSIVTAFGFAIIVPSLRNYFDDERQLRLVIIIGSLIPYCFYLLWEMVVFGVIPLHGYLGLNHLSEAKNPIAALVHYLSANTKSREILIAAKLFTSICVITAFLGSALSLSDYWQDVLGCRFRGRSGWVQYIVTFGPPVLIVLAVPSLFVKGISLAGICCLILLFLVPVLMWCQMKRSEVKSMK